VTDLPCGQAAVGAAVIVLLFVLIAGGAFDRWALVGGAAAGGALYVAIVCARQHPGR
jgi:hypothetical protein